MSNFSIEAKAFEEAQRLLEQNFSFFNPYTCIIDTSEIPSEQKEFFCMQVEAELLLKGEEINRKGEFFKIVKYNR